MSRWVVVWDEVVSYRSIVEADSKSEAIAAVKEGDHDSDSVFAEWIDDSFRAEKKQ